MGFYPVSKASIERVYPPYVPDKDCRRYIIVIWKDDVTTKEYTQKFAYEDMDKALVFFANKLNELAM